MDQRSDLPKSIQVTEDGTIVYFWHRFNVMILVFLVFDLMGIWTLASGLSKDVEHSPFLIAEFLCASPILILSYYILVRFLNRTEFWVQGGEFFIQHKPLPWFGNRAIPLSDIEGFALEETRAGGTYYHLFVNIRDKPRSKLFPMLSGLLIDLTNDTRRDVAVALYQQLINVVKKYISTTDSITKR